jgi:hypothetical protein
MFKHKWIDWTYIRSQPNLAALENIFQELGLYEFLNLKCPWNESVIKQFYATVEISFEHQLIEWMTGTNKYQASFQEFANAARIPYDEAFDSRDVHREVVLTENEWVIYYEAQGVVRVILGTIKGKGALPLTKS